MAPTRHGAVTRLSASLAPYSCSPVAGSEITSVTFRPSGDSHGDLRLRQASAQGGYHSLPWVGNSMIQSVTKARRGRGKAMATDVMAFGRDQPEWDLLAEAGEAFLIERARRGRLTSYAELNATLERRTGLRRFDFALQAERTAMGHLLGLIVAERDRPFTGLMISALVIYLDGDDAASGFYKLAQDLDELPLAR